MTTFSDSLAGASPAMSTAGTGGPSEARTGTALLDAGGRITDANRSLAELLGADPSDLAGSYLAEMLTGFSFRNVVALLIQGDEPQAECEVTWDHPAGGARSGRLIVSRLAPDLAQAQAQPPQPPPPPQLLVRLNSDADPTGYTRFSSAPALSERAITQLREAITGRRLQVHFQPIVDIGSARPAGIEALVRYTDHYGGLVMPAAFLGAAEESGLIVEVGTWVASRTAVSLSQLRRMEMGPEGLFAAVNVSARQLSLDDVARLVHNTLAATGLPPEALWLELSETAVLHPDELQADGLRELAEAGVLIGLDDFGTGPGSLASLRSLPVSFVKIDRTFVSGLGRNHADEVIVESIMGLADGLGITAIAEGVETEEQRSALEAMGCPLGQGFLWSEPRPLVDLLPMLRAPRP